MHFNNDRSQLHRWNKSNYNWECNLPGIKHSVLVLSSERTKKKKQKNGSRTSHVHIEYSRSHLAKQLYQTCPPQSRYGLFRTRSNPDDTAAILLIQIARSRALVKRIIRFFHGSFSSSSFFRERVIKIPPNKTNKQKKKKKKKKHMKSEREGEREKGKHVVKAAGVRFYQACAWIRPSDSGRRRRLNFMTGFPLIISSFCTGDRPGLIQSIPDSKRAASIRPRWMQHRAARCSALPLCWIKRSPCARWKLHIYICYVGSGYARRE